MPDFNSDITSYGTTIVPATTTVTQNTNPFLNSSVLNLTIQDIKNYIDILLVNSGYLTKDEITQKIQIIAEASGMLSQNEIIGLVTSTVNGLDVLTRDEGNVKIVQEVTTAILETNKNLDVINDVKDELNSRVDGMRQELLIISNDTNATHQKTTLIESNLNTKFTALQQNIRIIESIIDSIFESSELNALITIERNTRKTEVDNLKVQLETISSNKDEAISGVDSKLNATKIELTNANTHAINVIQGIDSFLRTKITTLENSNTGFTNLLNSLLLTGDELRTKLNILNEMDVTSSGEVIQDFYVKMTTLQNEVNTAISELNVQKTNINTGIANIGTLRDDLIQKIDTSLSGMFTSIQNTTGKLNFEIQERKTQTESILLEWSKFVKGTNELQNKMQLKLETLIMTTAQMPETVRAMLDLETKLRHRNEKAQNEKIDTVNQQLNNRISAIDPAVEFVTINRRIQDIQNRYLTFRRDFVDGTITELNNISTTLNQKIDINTTELDNKFKNEQIERELRDTQLNTKITAEREIRESRLDYITGELTTLYGMVDTISILTSSGDTAPMATAVATLNDRYTGIFNKVDGLIDTEAMHFVELDTSIKTLNRLVLGTQLNLLSDVQSETQARESSLVSINTQLQDIYGKIATIIGTVLDDDANLNAVYTKIDEVQANLDLFKVDFDDALGLEITGLGTQINLVNDRIDETILTVETEEASRIDEDNNLLDLINILETKVDASKIETLGLINSDVAELTIDIMDLDSKLNIEITSRKSADNIRTSELDTFRTELDNLNTSLNDEINTIDTQLLGNIDALSTTVNNEIATRIADVQTLNDRLLLEATDRNTEVTALQQKITEHSDTLDVLLGESGIDFGSLTQILDVIREVNTTPNNDVGVAILSGLTTLETSLTALINTESNNRSTAIGNVSTALTTLINTVALNLSTETTARTQAVLDLQSSIIDANIQTQTDLGTITTAVNQEILDRGAAVDALTISTTTSLNAVGDNLNEITTSVLAETNTRTAADLALNTRVDLVVADVDSSTQRIQILETKSTDLMFGALVEWDSLKKLHDFVLTTNLATDTKFTDTNAVFAQDIVTINTDISLEIQNRTQADTVLTTALSDLGTVVATLDTNTTTSLALLGTNLSDHETLVQGQFLSSNTEISGNTDAITGLTETLQTETTNRIADTLSIRTNTTIGDYNAATFKTIVELSSNLDAVNLGLTSALGTLQTETTARTVGDTTLDARIDSEVLGITNSLGTITTNLNQEILDRTQEILRVETIANANKTQLDSILLNATDTENSFVELKAIIDQNTSTQSTATTTLGNSLSADITSLQNSVATDVGLLDASITSLSTEVQTNLSTVTGLITTESTTRIDAVTTINASIANIESRLYTPRHDVMLESLDIALIEYSLTNTNQRTQVQYAVIGTDTNTATYTYDGINLDSILRIEYFTNNIKVGEKNYTYDINNRLTQVTYTSV